MEFVQSECGKRMLIHDGCIYVKQKEIAVLYIMNVRNVKKTVNPKLKLV